MKAESNVASVLSNYGTVYKDDTEYIQSCVDSGLTPPPGTYYIQSTIRITRSIIWQRCKFVLKAQDGGK